MTQLEKEVESLLRRKIEARGGMCLKWVCPGWAGVPDRICLLPGAKVFFVETKRPSWGKTSARQKWWADKIKSLGFEHYFIHNATDVRVLEKLLELEDEIHGTQTDL